MRHPHVSEAIERDFRAMVWLAATATRLFPALAGLRLEDTLKQFEAPLHEQARCGVVCACARAAWLAVCTVCVGLGLARTLHPPPIARHTT